MKIVLDSNILVVAIGQRSRFRPIWQAFLDERYQLILTGEILLEYEEILQEHAAPGAHEIVLQIFADSANILYKRIFYQWNAIIADADDNKFFDAAVAANVDFLVTNDGHFNEVKRLSFPKVTIVSADEFLRLLEKAKEE
jgi:predicted nucleic acid-binding protein